MKDWQVREPAEQSYPYDFDEDYRSGELTFFNEMVRIAGSQGAHVAILPLPLYGYDIAADDMETLSETVPDEVEIFDLYRALDVDFSTFWYDDAHVLTYPVGLLTTAVMAKHLSSKPGLMVEDD